MRSYDTQGSAIHGPDERVVHRGEQSVHGRRNLLASLIVLPSLLSAAVPGSAAAASASDHTSHVEAGCGAPVTVTTPTATAASSTASLARALSASPADPLIKRAAALHLHWLSSITCKSRPDRTRPLTAPAGRDASLAPDTSPNWSGYVQGYAPPAGTASQGVDEIWTVPTVTNLPGQPLQSTDSSMWPGIGGWGATGGDLVQAGTEQDYSCASIVHSTCQAPDSSYYFWYEVAPDENQQEITNLAISPGQDVSVEVDYFPSANLAAFYICQWWASGSCVDLTQPVAAPVGSTVDWVMERTKVNNALPPLADFGTANILSASYFDQNGGTVYGPFTPDPDGQTDMVNGSDQLDSTGALTPSQVAGGDQFTETWLAGT